MEEWLLREQCCCEHEPVHMYFNPCLQFSGGTYISKCGINTPCGNLMVNICRRTIPLSTVPTIILYPSLSQNFPFPHVFLTCVEGYFLVVLICISIGHPCWAPFVCVSTLGLDFVHFIVRFLVTVVELLYVFRIPFPNQYINANTFSHPTDSFLLHGQYSSYEVQLPWFSFGFLCFRYHIPHHSKPQFTMFCLPCFPSIV